MTSSRVLYYHISSSLSLNSSLNDDFCTQLRQIKFPKAYALLLKDLSRLINPTSSSSSSNLSINIIWELMPDIDEHQRLFNQNQQYSLQTKSNIHFINPIIPDIWEEIGKKKKKL